ncbi:MAG: hypothetical protein ACRD3Q_17405 [Terriglobales bacterium]
MDIGREALRALVRWRMQWEEEFAEGPSADSGQSPEELELWRLAGELMRAQGIKRRLP